MKIIYCVEWLSGYSVSASHAVSHRLASQPGHTKDHHEDVTNYLPAWHTVIWVLYEFNNAA